MTAESSVMVMGLLAGVSGDASQTAQLFVLSG